MEDIAKDTKDTIDISVGEQKGSGRFMYYRRPNGYITIGPAWPIERTRRTDKGDEALTRYGQFSDNPKVWNFHTEPFRRIIQLNGAKEFVPQQIVELGWYKTPPYAGVTFPQMESVPVHEEQCNFCKRWFFSHDKDLVEKNLFAHESTTHKEISSQQRLARMLAEATQGSTNSTLAVLVQQLLKKQEELELRVVELSSRASDGESKAQDITERKERK